jgi:hypothetical protein
LPSIAPWFMSQALPLELLSLAGVMSACLGDTENPGTIAATIRCILTDLLLLLSLPAMSCCKGFPSWPLPGADILALLFLVAWPQWVRR